MKVAQTAIEHTSSAAGGRRPVCGAPDIGEPMTCRECGDVIGCYEPLVLLLDGQPRTTSATAEPQVGDAPGEHFHRACYAEDRGAGAPA